MPDELADQVRTVVARYLDVVPDRLGDGTRLGEDLCVDSLAAAGLVLEVEDALHVVLPDGAFSGLATFAELVAVVRASSLPAA